MNGRTITPADLGLPGEMGWVEWEKLAITAAVIAIIMTLRWILLIAIRRSADRVSDWQRRAMSLVRNGGLFLAVVAVIGLWLPEIQDFALSITAFAVAIVIATKEFLMCLAGGLVRSVSGAFQAGDWIEVGDAAGEVSDQSWVATQILEYDFYAQCFTGRTITVPNSVFLSQRVINHGFRKRYVIHQFTIWSEPVRNPEAARKAVKAALTAAIQDQAEVASRYAALIEKRMGVELPPTEPRVRLRSTDLAKLGFEAMLFCPRDRVRDVEAAAYAAYWAWMSEMDAAAAAAEAVGG